MVIIMMNELKLIDAKNMSNEDKTYLDNQISKIYSDLETSKHFPSKKELLNASKSELVEELKAKLDEKILNDVINKMNFPEDMLQKQNRNHLTIEIYRLLINNINVFAVVYGRGNYELFADIHTSRICETSFTKEQSNFTISMLDGSKLKPFNKEYCQRYSFNNQPEKKFNDLLLSDELEKYMSKIVTTNNEFSDGITNLYIDKNSFIYTDQNKRFKVSFKTSSISCDLDIDEVVREAQEVQNVMRQCNKFLIENNMYKD